MSAINIDMIKSNPNYILNYEGYDDDFYKIAIEYGFKPTEEIALNNFYMLYSSTIISYLLDDNPNFIVRYEGTNLDVFAKALQLGFIPSKQYLIKYKSLCYIDCIMIKAIDLDYNNIQYYKGYNENVFAYAIDKGYKPKEQDFIKCPDLGKNENIMQQIDDKNLYKYYDGDNDDLIRKILCQFVNKYNDYIYFWKLCETNDERKNLMILLNEEIINKLASINISWNMFVRYTIKCDKLKYFIKIIQSNQLDDFINVFKFLKDRYYSFDHKAFGLDRFLNIAFNYFRYNNLINDVLNTKLSNNQLTNLYYAFENDKTFDVNNIIDLDNIGYKIEFIPNNKNSHELKNLILLYLCNHTYDDLKHILARSINFYTLDKMSKKYYSSDVEILKIFMSIVEDILHSTDDIESLNKVINSIIDNKELIESIRPYLYNLDEHIRNVYYQDINNTLLDLNKVPSECIYKEQYVSSSSIHMNNDDVKLNNQKVDYYILDNYKYAIYSHVCSISLQDLLSPFSKGNLFICFAPISHIEQKYYQGIKTNGRNDLVILGYNKIYPGSFVGSSNCGMDSKFDWNKNDYQIDLSYKINQMEIVDSSVTSYLYSETIMYRDGLLPCCVIISRSEPTQYEIDAAAYLSNMLHKKVPLVKVLNNNMIKDSIIASNYINCDNENIKNSLLQYYNKLLKIKIDINPVSNIIPVKIGGSHVMYRCIINNGRYLLKPGKMKKKEIYDQFKTFAIQCGYEIQKIVNPQGAVEVKIVDANVGNNNEIVCCAAIKEVIGAKDYSWIYDLLKTNISQCEISCFLKELIIDHLIYNYDCKASNFIYDINGQTYGIDKEQSLKHILGFAKVDGNGKVVDWDTHITYMYNPNQIRNIYKIIFFNYINGCQEISEDVIEECYESINRVMQIDDSDYLKIFEKYVENICSVNNYDNNIKKMLYDGILIRKKTLLDEFNIFLSNLKEDRKIKKLQ